MNHLYFIYWIVIVLLCYLTKIDWNDFDVIVRFVRFRIRLRIANILTDFHAFCYASKHSVFVVQPRLERREKTKWFSFNGWIIEWIRM